MSTLGLQKISASLCFLLPCEILHTTQLLVKYLSQNKASKQTKVQTVRQCRLKLSLKYKLCHDVPVALAGHDGAA